MDRHRPEPTGASGNAALGSHRPWEQARRVGRLLVLGSCIGLLGCSRSFNPATAGATGSSVTCTGMALAVRACVAQAGRSCASGHYAVFGGGGQIGDDRTGIADQFLSVVQATGAQVVCTAGPTSPDPGPGTTPNLSVPPSL